MPGSYRAYCSFSACNCSTSFPRRHAEKPSRIRERCTDRTPQPAPEKVKESSSPSRDDVWVFISYLTYIFSYEASKQGKCGVLRGGKLMVDLRLPVHSRPRCMVIKNIVTVKRYKRMSVRTLSNVMFWGGKVERRNYSTAPSKTIPNHKATKLG